MVNLPLLLRAWRMCLPCRIELLDDEVVPLLMRLSEPLMVKPFEPVPIVLPLGGIVGSVAPGVPIVAVVVVPVSLRIVPEPVEPDPRVCATAAVAISALTAITNIFMEYTPKSGAAATSGACLRRPVTKRYCLSEVCTSRRVAARLRPMLPPRFNFHGAWQ